MTKPYLLTLRPADTFFFGGEVTLGNGDNSNYFARSNLYPQQTALLGLLRHCLSEHNLPFGQESFNPDAASQQDFGAIKQLSPLFVIRKNADGSLSRLLPAPMFHLSDGSMLEARFLQNVKVYNHHSGDMEPAYQATGYDPKINQPGYGEMLLVEDGSSISIIEVFKPATRVGITKSESGQPREDAFYRQTTFKMTDNFSFACYVDLDIPEDTLAAWKSFPMQFGGERSIFLISVQETNDNFNALAQKVFKVSPKADAPALILLSDAFVGEDIYAHCHFSVTDTVDFRSIRSPLPGNGTNFAELDRNGQSITTALSKTAKYNLMRRGSVLYVRDEASAATIGTMLEKAAPFRKIGYNHYHTFS